ncbi:MAG: glycerol kinase GlpK [Polyangiaceae bacterium]|nr:glycerol kinase GlpK [Polyangiaceae bacterium]
MGFFIALDQGTTSSRAIIYNETAEIVATSQKEIQQSYPAPGWVEHDPVEIWESQAEVCRAVMHKAGLSPDDLLAVGITNQRETTILWERRTGRPIAPAIVWQDRRTAERCQELRDGPEGAEIAQRTGLVVDAYFSATKLEWLLKNIDGARAAAERGDLAFGTVDSWLLYWLTGKSKHMTDSSNASRTMLYNIHEQRWDDYLLELFGVPASILPEVKGSAEVYAEATGLDCLAGVPLAAVAGDQQAAMVGQLCVRPGVVKSTYGTGCFLLTSTGAEVQDSKNRLLSTVAWSFRNQVHYALEGGVFVGGALVQWLRDGLGVIEEAAEVEALAAQEDSSGGVVVVPALAGLGAPYWDPDARGTIYGITRGTNRAHIARASLDGIAHQVVDLVEALERDAQTPISELRVDGGAAANDLLMQIQADLLQLPVVRPMNLETTSLGVVFLAGLGIGHWAAFSELDEFWKRDRVFEPQLKLSEAQLQRATWVEAVERCRGWRRI